MDCVEKFKLSKPLLILPAAGYGTRVGSPESKELLPHPKTGQPLIEKSLEIAVQNKWDVHVVTRKEKQSLIDFLRKYAQEKKININIQVVEKTKEWPDTILKSQGFWQEKNLFLLPDAEWDPLMAPVALLDYLNTLRSISLGVFCPNSLTTWGAVQTVKSVEGEDKIFFCEKPSCVDSELAKAWGMIAFTKSVGLELFEVLLASTFDHQWRQGPHARYSFINLSSFHDLTR